MTWQPCGYGCGQPWRRWKGSTLIGHARCAIPAAEQDALLLRMEGSTVTLAQIAAEHGVSVATVRAWQRYALKRRAARHRRST